MFQKLATLSVLAGLAACTATVPVAPELTRCIWVDRWDWKTAADIDRIMDDCQRAGFKTVLFQVRGNGTVAWASQLEVWSERFDFRSPGFDPLQVAVAAAHRRGLKLHAWLNALAGWSGQQDPKDPNQLWNAHKAWFLHGPDGKPAPLAADGYRFLDPCLPEVRRYLGDLCAELATRYDIDGIHLDRIRFPDATGDAAALGTDPRTLLAFSTQTGRASGDRDALVHWQAAQVTGVIEAIRAALAKAPRHPLLTAAVFADPQLAASKVRQDWVDWCRRGLVHAVLPMNYSEDESLFRSRANAAVAAARRTPVVMGVGVYKLATGDAAVRQLDASLQSGAQGVAVFSYRSLFTGGSKSAPKDAEAMRQRIAGWLQQPGR